MGGEYVTSLGPFGCTESLVCNYSEVAISDNNSCIFPADFYHQEGHCLTTPTRTESIKMSLKERTKGMGWAPWDLKIQQCAKLIGVLQMQCRWYNLD